MTLGNIAELVAAIAAVIGIPLGLAIDGRSWKFPAINKVVNICLAVALLAILFVMHYYGIYDDSL